MMRCNGMRAANRKPNAFFSTPHLLSYPCRTYLPLSALGVPTARLLCSCMCLPREAVPGPRLQPNNPAATARLSAPPFLGALQFCAASCLFPTYLPRGAPPLLLPPGLPALSLQLSSSHTANLILRVLSPRAFHTSRPPIGLMHTTLLFHGHSCFHSSISTM